MLWHRRAVSRTQKTMISISTISCTIMCLICVRLKINLSIYHLPVLAFTMSKGFMIGPSSPEKRGVPKLRRMRGHTVANHHWFVQTWLACGWTKLWLNTTLVQIWHIYMHSDFMCRLADKACFAALRSANEPSPDSGWIQPRECVSKTSIFNEDGAVITQNLGQTWNIQPSACRN